LVNFVKFNGYEFGEASNNNVFTVGNDFQFNFMKNYYVTASLSVGNFLIILMMQISSKLITLLLELQQDMILRSDKSK
jgi:hypothetical protein